jgi:hypothetical protein
MDTPCNRGELLKALAAPVRNRYFHGKLLDALHLDLEQLYFNRKRQLLSRLALGPGVLRGLRVAPTNDGKSLVVGPGVAIDDFGREIVVPAASIAIDPRQPTDLCGRPQGDRFPGARTVHLCIAYLECEAEPVPVVGGDCDALAQCKASVAREAYCLVVRDGAPLASAPACGMPELFPAPPAAPLTAAQRHARLVQRCLQLPTEVTGDGCVVLAQIKLPAPGTLLTDAMIDASFRPLVYDNDLLYELLLCATARPAGLDPLAEPPLTTIVQSSWATGQSLSIDRLMGDGLTVRFSAAVQAATPDDGDGWFLVSMEYPVLEVRDRSAVLARGTRLVQRLAGSAGLAPDGMSATFKPAEAFLGAFRDALQATGLPGDVAPLCRVVIKCAALVDGNAHAVDGDLLAARLPSGDGVAGGDFESWFRIDRN